jgi:hypothetical protein
MGGAGAIVAGSRDARALRARRLSTRRAMAPCDRFRRFSRGATAVQYVT